MILVDYRNVAIGCASKELKESGGVTAVTGFYILNKLRMFNKQFGPKYGEMVLCNDFGSWRYEKFEHYKAARRVGKKDEGYLVTLELIDELFDDIYLESQWHAIRLKGVEADDIMAVLCSVDDSKQQGLDVGGGDNNHIIISSDKDMAQQRMRGADVYNPIKRSVVTSKSPQEDLNELIIRGDSIDGIPNIISDADTLVMKDKRQRPMRKNIIEHLLSAPSIEEGIQTVEVKGIGADEILENYERNKILIDLQYIPDDVKLDIIAAFEVSEPQRNALGMMKIFAKYKSSRLLENSGDFKLFTKE